MALNEAAIIAGVFKGNIGWPGIVHVAASAELVIESKVSCREIEVAGKVSGGQVAAPCGRDVAASLSLQQMRRCGLARVDAEAEVR